MSDTYQTNCNKCYLEIDFISGTGETPICDDCQDEQDRETWCSKDQGCKCNT